MKKKFVILFLSIACALCLAFAFAGCTDENGESLWGGTNTQQGETGDTGSSDSGSDNTGGGHVHNYGNLIPEKSATCAEEGLQAHYYCSGCQTYFDGDKNETTLDELKISVDPNAHNYGNLTPEKPATCTEVGLQAHYYCSGCQKYFNDQKVEKSLNDLTIPALGHILEENQLVCKTCNEQLAESLTFELNSDNTYKLTSGTPTSGGKIMIPKIYNNLPVTSIGDRAFWGCTSLENITLPNSVTSIGDRAFWGCTSLENITLPNSVTSIGSEAFGGCESLESINIPDSVTNIEEWAFAVCTSLESITIGNGVVSIGDGAFGICTSLTSVYITNIVAWCNIDFDSIGANPLWYAHNLYLNNNLVTELTAEMLQGVTTIKDYAFYGCTSLESVTIPDSVTSIGEDAFRWCESLESVTIPNGVTSIGGGAFYGCTNLTSVIFNNPDGWYRTKDSSATGGTDIPSEDLKNPQTAAAFLRNTYYEYHWERKS